MSVHAKSHSLAGQTVIIGDGVKDPRGMVNAGAEYRVEDYWDRVSGKSWQVSDWNPAALQYVLRIGLSGHDVPLDDEVLYGKIANIGHLVHVTEIRRGAQ
jgi:hypothetical protein